VVHVVSQSDNAETVAQAIRDNGGKARAHRGSVADNGFCRQVVAAAEADGGVDLLVNAAGVVGASGKFTDIPPEAFTEVLAINLLGPCNFMHAALPVMQKKGFGRIVNFAGGGAAYAYPNFTPYGTSKVALVRLTETIADEIEPGNVTVNIIAPGAVATDMLAEIRRAGGEVRTVVDIKEPVRLVHFLCTAGAAHIHGRFIHARDNYEDASLFDARDMLKLRRVEKR